MVLLSQDASYILKNATAYNQKITNGIYDYRSKLKFAQSSDTLTVNSNIVFQAHGSHTLCYQYDKDKKTIDIYDPSQYKKRLNLVDSNIYITLKNSPEADHILFDYVRPYFLMDLPQGKQGWEKEAETDKYYVLVNRRNTDPQTIYETWARLYIEKRSFIPFKFEEYYALIEPGVDTLVQYTEQQISNYRFNIPVAEIAHKFKVDPSFPLKKIIQSVGSAESGPDTALINNSITDLQLTAMNGQIIDLKKTDFKVIVLDFYYSACYPCMLALPVLGNLYRQYKDKGVAIIGINPFDKDMVRLQKLLAVKNVTYPTCLNTQDLARLYKITAYPTMLIFNRNKQLVQRIKGFGPELEKDLTRLIEKMLKED